MRIIRIIFFSLLALCLVACMGTFIFFQTFDADQYLSQMTQKASRALGRSVSIGGVGLGLSSQGITLDAGPLTITDDLSFTKQPFITVDKVRCSLDLTALIFQRKIHVIEILLQSPEIHFIRSQGGDINFRSIVHTSSVKTPALPSASVELTAKQSFNVEKKEQGLLSGINIKHIRIQDAAISFIDQNQTTPLDIWLSHINANLNDFSLLKPFQLSFESSPLLFKGVSPGMPDSPVFRNVSGVIQLNRIHSEIGDLGTFTGNGNIIITDGVIKGFNIIKVVLSHTLGGFGGMEVNIDNLLSGQLKSKLGAADTAIERLEVHYSFHDKAVFIDNSLIQTNIFELTAQGSVDEGLNTDMQTMLHLNEDVSNALVHEIEGLKSLCDDSKRIVIGASLKGVIPHLKYKPNKEFRKKSKKILMEEGGNILGALLGGGKI